MSASRVRAALGLLSKVLPDLSATQLSNDPNNPLPSMGGVHVYLPDNGRTTVDVRPGDPKALVQSLVVEGGNNNVVPITKQKEKA